MSPPYVECPFTVLGLDYMAGQEDVEAAYQKLALEYFANQNFDPAAAEWMNKISRAREAALAQFDRYEEGELVDDEEPEPYPHPSYLVRLHQPKEAQLAAGEARRTRQRDHLMGHLQAYFMLEQSHFWKNSMEPHVFVGPDENPDAKAFQEHIARLNVIHSQHDAKIFAEEIIMNLDKQVLNKLHEGAWRTLEQDRRMTKKYNKCGWHPEQASCREDLTQKYQDFEFEKIRQEIRNGEYDDSANNQGTGVE